MKNAFGTLLGAGVIALLSAGCSTPSGTATKTEATPPKEVAKSPVAKEAKAQEAIPEELKHDGFLYAGLSPEAATQMFIVRMSDRPDAESRTTTRFVGMKHGSATFERTRDGALSSVGSDTVRVSKTGVYVIGMSIGKLEGPTLELPAKLAPGNSWKVNSKVDSESGPIENSGTYKVVGMEKVTVPAGEYDALKITFDGKLKTNALQADVSGTYWFVKGVGAVKTELRKSQPGQPVASIAIELKL